MSEELSDDLKEVVKDAVDIAASAGRIIAGLGMRVAAVHSNPKKCAMSLLECGKQFDAVATACNELAAKICEIDAKSISVVEKGGLVDAKGRPIGS